MGKIDELRYDRDMGYSDEGQLIGHMVMGVGLVGKEDRRSRDGFPARLTWARKPCSV